MWHETAGDDWAPRAALPGDRRRRRRHRWRRVHWPVDGLLPRPGPARPARRRARGGGRRLRRVGSKRWMVLCAVPPLHGIARRVGPVDPPRWRCSRRCGRRSTRSEPSSWRRASTADSPKVARSAPPARCHSWHGREPRSPRAREFGSTEEDLALLSEHAGRGPCANERTARRAVHPSLRRHPSGPPGARSRRCRRGGGTPCVRADARHRDRAATGDHAARVGSRRRRRAGHGGVHAATARSAARCRARLLLDGGDRAAARRRLGHDRSGRTGDVHRPAPPHHLRAAHRRRTYRLRRSRRPVPLRLRRARGLRPLPEGVRRPPSHAVDLFPVLTSARFTHAWGGPLAIPRDWCASVGYDKSSGMAWAGGYVGDGVSTSNLAGRTLADLITGTPVGPRRPPLGRPPLAAVGAGATALVGHQHRAGRR